MRESGTFGEEILCRAYQEEADLYAQALEVAANLPVAFQRGQNVDEPLERIASLLGEVAAIEGRIAPAKHAWKETRQRPGPQLGALLTRVTDLIQRLSEPIARAEQEATRRRDQLVPELDALARRQQMQRAYGGVLTSPDSVD